MGQSLSLALFQAASSGDAQRIKLLVNQGADVHATDDENGWTALHYATWAGQVSCVRELLVGGGEVDARDNELKTPLHYAVLGGHEAIMQSLLNHGAQVNAADISGQTALHKASAQGQLRFVQELIARGADVNARLQDGSSAIHLASWKGHTSVLEYLLQHGGNVDSLNSNGEAALHEAARYGNEDCCRLLMRRGASTSVLNHEGQTPADVAEQSSHLRTASLVSPDPKQVAKQKQIQELQRRQNTPSAQPSAPTAPYFTDTERVTYPVINPPTQTETPGLGFHKREEGNTSSKNGPATQRSRRYGLPEEDDSDDWEPRTSEDWEGIEAPNNVESQGGRLMNRFEQEDDTSGQTQDPFWMIPGPIKWAAGSIGGVLNNVNPFKSPRANPPESQTQEVPKSPEALESALEDKKAEVSKLKSSEKTQELTDFQLKRLKDQEAEIAALKKQLDESKSEPQASSSKIPENSKSAKSRHHIIDLPPASQSTARLLSRENLQRATNGFSYKISETPEGTFYRGKLDNANMLVSVPKDRGFLPNESVKQAANKLANLAANPFGSQLLSLRAYSEDGCAVYELLENGTVEDSLRSRIPVPGKQPHRLDWNSRAKVALTTAQGLLGLRQEGLQHRPAALLPNKVYLGSLGQAKILPPSISSLVTGQETVASQISYIAPEVREGGNQSVKSDVFSLGVFLLQLLTGSEASGLIQYVDSALKSGKLETILDPCAEGISVPSAISLAKLALRCAEFHPEARPDLENEILPQLHNLVGTVENGLSAPSEEPPEHLVCPITQEVMEKPVILADGYTYEESAIRKWLSTGKQVSPMTNQQLENLTLTPNYVIKSAASTWREKHPENLSSTSTYSQKPAQNPANPRLKQEVDEMNQILSQNEENLQSNPGVQSQVSDESVITDSDLPSPPNHAYWASSNEESIPQRQYAS